MTAAITKEMIISTIPIRIVTPAMPLAPNAAATTPMIIKRKANQNKLNIFYLSCGEHIVVTHFNLY
jgi:hypothetical protein